VIHRTKNPTTKYGRIAINNFAKDSNTSTLFFAILINFGAAYSFRMNPKKAIMRI
jgi:hypothetical protein